MTWQQDYDILISTPTDTSRCDGFGPLLCCQGIQGTVHHCLDFSKRSVIDNAAAVRMSLHSV